MALGRHLVQKLPRADLNRYDYVPSEDGCNTIDDRDGYRCPLGAHMRRNNPRGEATVPGGVGHKRRIIRRGMPYGPAYRGDPNDGIERGLVGLFINASLESQFEFLMHIWVNGEAPSTQARGYILKGRDVLLGDNDPSTSMFQIPRQTADGNQTRDQGN